MRSTAPRTLSTLLLAPLALLGCIEPAPLAHQGEPRSGQIAMAPVGKPVPGIPADTHPAGAVFGNVLQVAAYKVDPPAIAPGQRATVTLYLRALAPIPDDYMMFVHVDDSTGRPERINADHWPLGHRSPTNTWKPGEIVADPFTFTLSGFNESSAITLWMGFYLPNQDQRLPLSNPGQVKNDGNNRYALADVPIAR